MNTKTIRGTYGNRYTPCNIHVYQSGGLYWYAVQGSVNINAVNNGDLLRDGVDVEILPDVDTITSGVEICDIENLVEAVDVR